MSENICSIGASFVPPGSIASVVVCIKVTMHRYLTVQYLTPLLLHIIIILLMMIHRLLLYV